MGCTLRKGGNPLCAHSGMEVIHGVHIHGKGGNPWFAHSGTEVIHGLHTLRKGGNP